MLSRLSTLALVLTLTTSLAAEEQKEEKKTEKKKVKVVAAQAAVGARVVIGSRAVGSNAAVRANADPDDPVERFLVLAPGAPLVVQVSITVEGKPFRHLREELVKDMMSVADVNKDGKAMWEEALRSSRFTFGRFNTTNEASIKNYAKQFDTNKDSLVDIAEARQFLARNAGGPAFQVTRGYNYSGQVAFGNGQLYRGNTNVQANVKALLDTDKNGELSAEEIKAAPERLKSRDADDNDLLYANEIAGAGQPNNRRIQAVRGGTVRYQQLGILLGPTVQASALHYALKQKYGDKITSESFTTMPGLFEQLDKNKDGELQQDEALALNDIKPHIELAVNLANTDSSKRNEEEKSKVAVTNLDERLKNTDPDNSWAVALMQPGFHLKFAGNPTQTYNYNYNATADRFLQMYDKDNNKYLDKNEMQGNLARQFQMWDADLDGKVYKKEIVEVYNRMRAPQMSQVRGQVAEQDNAMFLALDQTGDGRLSLREMRTAAEQLKSFDKNKDGQIKTDEIPVTMNISFSRGPYSYYVRTNRGTGTQPAIANPQNAGAPAWFTRMDRNGDGDLTLKEFLGTEEQFKKLDTNNDGFIERKEAKASETEK